MKFKKLLSLAAAAAVTVSALPSVFADSYSDISGHWAEAAINRLSDNGIIQGSDGKVRPEDYISRAELSTVLYNAMGGDGTAAKSTEYSQTGTGDQWVSSALSDGNEDAAGFSDFDADKWYASALKWAVGAGIITGYEDNTLKPENPVTRQEAVVIIQRACGIDGSGDITASDAAEVGDWAKDAVGSFMQNGFLNGDDNGKVNPAANIKRSELFTLLNNIIGEFITASGEYDNINCGNKLIIVKSGSAVIKNAKCGRIIIGADASEPEIDNVKVKIKVFGTKTVRMPLNNSSSCNSSGN
ncbi:MAG: S-layer homology domain-containing protein [Clostridia bacterium]|nr:S-layer homology domain-containing protein [Clostridia bacterium]